MEDAKTMLNEITEDTISWHVSHQAARMLYYAANSLVEHFQVEGILSDKDALNLFEEYADGLKHMDSVRKVKLSEARRSTSEMSRYNSMK